MIQKQEPEKKILFIFDQKYGHLVWRFDQTFALVKSRKLFLWMRIIHGRYLTAPRVFNISVLWFIFIVHGMELYTKQYSHSS